MRSRVVGSAASRRSGPQHPWPSWTGAVVIKVSLANVCGSDMHDRKGEQDFAEMGRALPLHTGHEHMGTIHKLGPGVTTDSNGEPLQEGERVIYRYFNPCMRC